MDGQRLHTSSGPAGRPAPSIFSRTPQLDVVQPPYLFIAGARPLVLRGMKQTGVGSQFVRPEAVAATVKPHTQRLAASARSFRSAASVNSEAYASFAAYNAASARLAAYAPHLRSARKLRTSLESKASPCMVRAALSHHACEDPEASALQQPSAQARCSSATSWSVSSFPERVSGATSERASTSKELTPRRQPPLPMHSLSKQVLAGALRPVPWRPPVPEQHELASTFDAQTTVSAVRADDLTAQRLVVASVRAIRRESTAAVEAKRAAAQRLRIRAWRAENNEVLDRELARMRQAQELRACSSAQRMRAVSARAPAEVRQWAAEHERQVAAGRAARHAATSHFNAPVRTESAFRGM